MPWGVVHYYYNPPEPKKDVNSEYNNLLATIQKVLNKHAPLKSRIIRGNQAPLYEQGVKQGNYEEVSAQNQVQ